MNPDVVAAARSFKAIRASTSGAVLRKSLLLHPNPEGERVGVVVADVLRRSTALLASFATGHAPVKFRSTLIGDASGT